MDKSCASKDTDSHPLGFIITWNTIAVLSVIVNSVHLAVVSTQPELKTKSYSNFKLFLMMTGIGDLILGVLWTLFSNQLFQNFLKESPALCITTAVYLSSKHAAHLMFILLVSVDRAICIRKCIKYQQRKFVKGFPAVIAVVCVLFPVIYSVEGILYGNVLKPHGIGLCAYCHYKPGITPIFIPLLAYKGLCVLAIIILNAYAAILAKVKLAKSKNHRRYNRMIEVTKVLVAIVVWTIITWIPWVIHDCLRALGVNQDWMFYLSLTVLALDNTMTPFLYSLTNQTYRRAVVNKFITQCRRQKVSRSPKSVGDISSPCPTRLQSISESISPRSSNSLFNPQTI